jgi:hypothetical protein
MTSTRRQAAWTGASYAAVSAVAYLAGVAAASVVAGSHWSLAAPRLALDPQAFALPVPIRMAASVASAAFTGALIGRLAHRLSGSPLRRVAVLVLVAVPALLLSVATVLTVLFAPHVIKTGLAALAVLPFACLLYAAFGTVFMLPTAIVPIVICALLVEGATRPAELGQGGMAAPAARRLALQILVAVAVACGTFAWFR